MVPAEASTSPDTTSGVPYWPCLVETPGAEAITSCADGRRAKSSTRKTPKTRRGREGLGGRKGEWAVVSKQGGENASQQEQQEQHDGGFLGVQLGTCIHLPETKHEMYVPNLMYKVIPEAASLSNHDSVVWR